jgi:8-oxo-dGTP pyrophosphatase MutT (NUDIX family)
VTGSALVVSHDGEQVLLTLHGKLGKWLQLGGHSDDDPRTTAVALREGHEESGMTGLTLWRWEHAFGLPIEGTEALALDLDVHDIPARGEMPQHAHHDIRFVVRAPKDAMPQISAESKDLRWFSLKEARALTQERSMTRQFDKWEWLRKKF